MDAYLVLAWFDSRLNFLSNWSVNRIGLDYETRQNIWLPDIFIEYTKINKTHKLFQELMYAILRKNKEILVSLK